ncbi:hypothetical protein VNO78_14749 [Psophocarpus tetragonolobus]|uniref:Uncharacterized protein n=1 Tax=Psophocarpus tetragonolobus TaxID=3891 RepID=A0AAN9XIJ7_PSOTE
MHRRFPQILRRPGWMPPVLVVKLARLRQDPGGFDSPVTTVVSISTMLFPMDMVSTVSTSRNGSVSSTPR